MPDVAYNLLTEPLFTITTPAGAKRRLDLPSVLEAFGRREGIEFAALQVHQQQPWYCFLVQLAAIALSVHGKSEPRQEAADWREWLSALIPSSEEAWALLVADLAKPAFLQTPVPEGSLSRYRNTLATPAELDILVTAKNHEIKIGRIHSPEPEHWIFALVSLQTMQGYSGRSNYGIARMNGGFASRPLVGWVPALDWATRFLRDTAVLLEARDSIVADHGYQANGGYALLWAEPWDGVKSLPLSACDPFFIEACRRVRIVDASGKLRARAAPTSVARMQAKELKGDVGDPWIPIDREDGKALTVPAAGFTYRRTRDLLVGADWTRAAALGLQPSDPESPYFVASVLVRGQGRTDGLHGRQLRLPARARRLLGNPEGRERVERLSRALAEAVVEAQKRVLRPALRALLGSSPNPSVQRWLLAHDKEVDRIFFERLWTSLDEPEDQSQAEWQRILLDLARDVLESAIAHAPLPAARRYQAIAGAEGLFISLARKHFPDANAVRPSR